MLKNGFRGPVVRHVDPPHSLINQWNQEMATPPTTHTSSLLSCTFSPYPLFCSPSSHPHYFPSLPLFPLNSLLFPFFTPSFPRILSSIHTLTSLPLPPFPLFYSHPHFPSPPPLSSLLFTPSLPFPSPLSLSSIHTLTSLPLPPYPLFYSHPHFPSPPPFPSLLFTPSLPFPSPLILSSIHTLTSLPLPPFPLFYSHPHFPSPPPLSSLRFTPSLPFPSPLPPYPLFCSPSSHPHFPSPLILAMDKKQGQLGGPKTTHTNYHKNECHSDDLFWGEPCRPLQLTVSSCCFFSTISGAR